MADWKMPGWMEPYRSLIGKGYPFKSEQIEDIVNEDPPWDNECANELAVIARVDLLNDLYEQGFLFLPEGR